MSVPDLGGRRPHARHDTVDVASCFAAVTDAAVVLWAFRGTHSGPATPVNAWWGSFDVAVTIDVDAAGPGSASASREVTVGWWPGDAIHRQPSVYAYASPAPDRLEHAVLTPSTTLGRWPRGVRARLDLRVRPRHHRSGRA